METSVFVVSDLHLGGADDFQMCSAQGQQQLAKFFEWVASQAGRNRRIELVIAGDIVDFLAVEDQEGGTWTAFTSDEDEALRKFEQILRSTTPIWNALANCVAAQCVITLMLGNHDIELSFPRVRQRLLERLGPGRIDFLYDNQAYTRGTLLIEHGNRYEGWNVVDHDALRRVRSELSRRETGGEFPVQPGSNLVVKVMNKLKQDYAWVDLLKPETSGVIPMLAVMNASLWNKFGAAILAGVGAAWREKQFGRDRMPTKDTFINEQKSPDEDIEDWLRAHLDDGSTQISDDTGLKKDLMFSALRKWGEKDGRSFQVEREDKRYQEAAQTLARNGYDVVIFGHTHHVKRVALADPAYGVYFNTGTWADLICIPHEVFESDEAAAKQKFDVFFESLKKNDVQKIRRLLPTFARVDFDNANSITAKDVYFFDAPDKIVPVDSAGILSRLA